MIQIRALLLCAVLNYAPLLFAQVQTPLPDCTHDDELDCKEGCRRLFDSAFHQCVSACKDKRCRDPKKSGHEREAKERSGLQCLEIESDTCAGQCASEPRDRRLRCRRGCLLEVCPDADQNEIAAEALDPGQLACNRCKTDHELECRRICSGSGWGSAAGLKQLACQKACVYTNCGKRCGPSQL